MEASQGTQGCRPTYPNIPIDAKEGFVRTVHCFLMAGDEKQLTNFDKLHWRTGKRVSRFS